MYDVVIIGGGGPGGGYVCAIRAAQHGLSVALVEKDKLGGTCLNRGCIPTKALTHTAEVIDSARRASEFGLVIPEAGVDFPRVMSKKDRVVARLRGGGVNLLMKRGGKIDVVSGVGTLRGEREKWKLRLPTVRSRDLRQGILLLRPDPSPLRPGSLGMTESMYH